MTGLYLTIDDSPSAIFPQMCAFLKERNIPAVYFARGDLMSLYPNEIVQAIKDGFVIANHSWSHHRASRLGARNAIAEVLKTQTLIDKLHAAAGKPAPARTMRFPYMDSGLGGWPLPPEIFPDDQRAYIARDYGALYGNDMTPPDAARQACQKDIENGLREAGFRQVVFEGVEMDWYQTYAASNAVSTQGTFCHPDWILNRRYEGKFPAEERTTAAMNRNLDAFVAANPGNHILVMHDSVELWPHFQGMIDHALAAGHTFLPIPV